MKQNISDSVLNSGWIAMIPQRGLQVNKWFGYGWQIIDPNSGAAGYLLAGYLTSGGAITAGGSGTDALIDFIHFKDAIAAIAGVIADLTTLGLRVYAVYAAAEISISFAAAHAAALTPGSKVAVIAVGFLVVAAFLRIQSFTYGMNILKRRWYSFSREVMWV
ncbi:MAG: hypothetical protein ACYDEQ_01760 [Desulfocucumaceae bacterium]